MSTNKARMLATICFLTGFAWAGMTHVLYLYSDHNYEAFLAVREAFPMLEDRFGRVMHAVIVSSVLLLGIIVVGLGFSRHRYWFWGFVLGGLIGVGVAGTTESAMPDLTALI